MCAFTEKCSLCQWTNYFNDVLSKLVALTIILNRLTIKMVHYGLICWKMFIVPMNKLFQCRNNIISNHISSMQKDYLYSIRKIKSKLNRIIIKLNFLIQLKIKLKNLFIKLIFFFWLNDKVINRITNIKSV